jgi:hypothetical protein
MSRKPCRHPFPVPAGQLKSRRPLPGLRGRVVATAEV